MISTLRTAYYVNLIILIYLPLLYKYNYSLVTSTQETFTSFAESICLRLSQFAFSFKEEELTVKTVQNSCLNYAGLIT
jgi:hypothetical protein